MSDRILIVRLGSLGDLVHTLPAVSALRRAHPASQIDWLVDAPHREFLELVPVVSSLVVLEDRGAGAWLEARRRMRARGYDVAIDFQGLVKSAALARLSGARRVVGFDRRALRESLAAAFYTERVEVGEGTHVVHKNMRLAAALGATATDLEFPIAAVESSAIEAFVAAQATPFALINPGAAWPNKRWPAERLGEVARRIRDHHGLASVVLWGPGEEAAGKSVVDAAGGAARLAPPTGLKDLIALARHARLIVSGDTGPLHIAAAVGVRAVALFGPTNPARNGPWDPNDISISRYASCTCHYERRCRHDAAGWCLGTVTVDEVMAAIDRRLRN
jgi:heptosyltransferase-1